MEPAPRFSITLWQIMESVFWVSVGLAMVKVIADVGQEAWFNNSILLFTMFFPGPVFGAAFGALAVARTHSPSTRFALRLLYAGFGFFLWIAVLWAGGPAAQ